MSEVPTTNYALLKVDPFTDIDTWGPMINGNWDIVDIQMKANATAAATNATAAATAQAAAVAAQATATAALPKAGGTMTGALVLAGDAGAALNPTSLQQVTASLATKAASVHTHVAADISDSTAAGRAVLTAATVAAQRVALDVDELGMLAGLTTKAANFDFALVDRGTMIESNLGTAIIGTVRLNATIAFPINTRIDLFRYGAGAFTIAPEAGVTINSKAGKLALAAQFSGATLYKRGTNEWHLIGDLA